MDNVSRILVFVPNWVGDVVMATAAMRAIRLHFAGARIMHVMRPYVADVLAGADLCDEMAFFPTGQHRNSLLQHARLVHQLRRESIDLAILLTNSFRSALVARLAGVRRRVGFDRDGRGWLLTDRLSPRKENGDYVPVPALDYYNELARHVGCGDPGDRLVLAATSADEAAIDARLGRIETGQPLVVLNPGANYGSAKCWPAESFAAVADALVERYGARVVASLVPKEREIADRLKATAKQPIDVFVDPPLGLGPLKALVRRCDLLITNDTGPRHFAAAFDRPVVTVFGSSDPAWTDTRFAKERIVTLDLECQPCMERTCPLGHHNCMRLLKPEAVLEKVGELLTPRPAVATISR